MNDPLRPQGQQASGFDFNRPTIISLLYLASFVTGITVIIGIVLAYIWRGEPGEAWEKSHYDYLIRTFWIALAGGIIGTLLMIVLIGFVILLAVTVWVIIRSVISLTNAQKRAPVANPATWLF